MIKTVSETYFNLLYYFKTIFNGNFKRIFKGVLTCLKPY